MVNNRERLQVNKETKSREGKREAQTSGSRKSFAGGSMLRLVAINNHHGDNSARSASPCRKKGESRRGREREGEKEKKEDAK